MQPRRRIDWPEILGPGDPSPIWKSAPARSDVVSLVRNFAPLFGARHPDVFQSLRGTTPRAYLGRRGAKASRKRA